MTAQDLKNSILQLAMRGKLVEQRTEEGTAKELIVQIGIEKERLIKEGKIRKEKPLPKITEEEIPFEIPKSWEWVRWGNLANSIQYGYNAPSAPQGNIRIVRISDIQSNIVNWNTVPYCQISEKEIPMYLLSENDLLFARTGGTVGKSYLVTNLTERAIFAGYLIRSNYNKSLCSKYLKYFMESPLYWSQLQSGITQTAQPNCNGKTLSKMMIPIPPIEEQKRIVKKMDEILPYIEQYKMAYSKLEIFNKKFPEDIQKSLLQYAMQGKLVEQRPEEGTGEELYRKIQAEKEKLIKEGKIKKEKSLPRISEDEIPFDIPDTWVWVKVGDLFTVIRGSSPRPKGSPLYWADKKTNYSWITIKDISLFCKDGVLSQTTEYLTEAGAGLSTYVESDELIIAVSGSTTGKHCVLGIDGYIYDGLAAILNPTKIISSSYLLLFFDWVYDRLNAQKVGSAFPNINTDILKNTLMPLPPLKEQERMVMAMKSIVPFCQRLAK